MKELIFNISLRKGLSDTSFLIQWKQMYHVTQGFDLIYILVSGNLYLDNILLIFNLLY